MEQPPNQPGTEAQARHQASRALFERALAADGAARRAVLDEARVSDPALADEVEAMLGYFAQTDAALDQPPAALLGEHTPVAAVDEELASGLLAAGTVVARWTIERVLAQGGESVVYAAVETTAPSSALAAPTVALRVVRPELVTAEMLARFEALGPRVMAPEHAGLARVLWAGAAEIGGALRPVIVMELVSGAGLTEAAADMTPRERAAVLAALARAVDAAHASGVVDGELTPDRVRVREGGAVKVLGFGVDRLLIHGPAPTARGLAVREARGAASPHTAPERQHRGDATESAAWDVYALGVMAYEVLAGRRPRVGTGTAAVVPPSRAGAGRESPRALDAIVMCAMAADPAARYRSAAEMAADLERWLAETGAGAPRGKPRSLRPHFWLVLALAIAGTVAGALVKWLVS